MNNSKKPLLMIAIVVLTALVVTLIINLLRPHQDWINYESEEGFSFKHPKGYGVNEVLDPENAKNTIIHIIELNKDGEFAEVTPSLQINVSSNSVSFALWEGKKWEGYPDIIRTFTQ